MSLPEKKLSEMKPFAALRDRVSVLEQAGDTSYTDERARDVVAAMIKPGSNVTLAYDDVADTLTISAAGAAAPYLFTQSSAASTWTINHNLGFYPVIDVLSPGRVVVDADVTHASVNQAVITFNVPYAGQAIAR